MITASGTCYHVLITLTLPVSPVPALLETSFPPDSTRTLTVGPPGHPPGAPQPLCVPWASCFPGGGIGSKPCFIPQAPITTTHRQFHLMSFKLT